MRLDLDHSDPSATVVGNDGVSGPTPDGGVSVRTPDGGEVLVDPRSHRADVVRRLLCLGVSARTLITLLPDWAPLIRTTALSLSPDDLAPHED